MDLTKDELNLIRQWFNAVQDLNPAYLTDEDLVLGSKITDALEQSIGRSTPYELLPAKIPLKYNREALVKKPWR